jgi:WhiB family redox-sensing transcriptional regulator
VRTKLEWRDLAACVNQDPELFFPVSEAGPAAAQVEHAKQVCARCLVREPCLTWAITANIQDGVWGGFTETERRTIQRRRLTQPRRIPLSAQD